MRTIIEVISWFTGRRVWALLAAKIAEREGDMAGAAEMREYAARLQR